MKSIKSTFYSLLVVSSFLGTLASASDLQSSYGFQKLQVALCENAKQDKVAQLRYNLRKARMHIRGVYSAVNCGGETLLSIAMDNNSDEMVAYLRSKTDALHQQASTRVAVN